MEYIMLGGLFSMLYGLPILAIFAVLGIGMLIGIAIYVLTAIPVHKLAKNAGLPNAWLAWIPYGNVYIMLNLARREFNIFDWIKTYDRTKVFGYYMIFALASMPAINLVMTGLAFIPGVNVLVSLISPVISTAYIVAMYIFNWRMYYDILMTYGMKDNAMVLSVFSSFCPIVMIVWSYMIMDREPDYSA